MTNNVIKICRIKTKGIMGILDIRMSVYDYIYAW